MRKNEPKLWLKNFPWPKRAGNKYSRGHAIIIGGDVKSTGAARLSAASAEATLRAGAGLVTVICTKKSLPVYAKTLTAVMTKTADNLSQLKKILSDKKINAALIGPGAGVNKKTQEMVLAILASGKKTVLDADSISVFQDEPEKLFKSIKSCREDVILTPHEGEFRRIFSVKGNKAERTQKAAKQSGAVVLLKGEDTIIASPNGKIIINNNAPPTLATAGSGDVLAGIILGLFAAGMSAFDAACAGAWIHGASANKFGEGLIAEDLPKLIPEVLNVLRKKK